MCDTLCVLGSGRTLFGRNSDRPVTEARVAEVHERRPRGGRLRATYVEPEDAGATALRERVEGEGGEGEGGADELTDIRAVLAPLETDLWEEADAVAASGDPARLAACTARSWVRVDAALAKLGV